MTHIYQPSSTA